MEYYQSVELFPSMLSIHNKEVCPYTQDHAVEAFQVTTMREQRHHLKSLSQAQKFRKGLQILQVNEDKGTTTTNTDNGQLQLDSGARVDAPTNADLKKLEEVELLWNKTKHGQIWNARTVL